MVYLLPIILKWLLSKMINWSRLAVIPIIKRRSSECFVAIKKKWVEFVWDIRLNELSNWFFRKLTGCRDKDFKPKILQHGDFTVLRNYIRAEHGEIGCADSVTYVTQGDVSFLDNLIPVLERWFDFLNLFRIANSF